MWFFRLLTICLVFIISGCSLEQLRSSEQAPLQVRKVSLADEQNRKPAIIFPTTSVIYLSDFLQQSDIRAIFNKLTALKYEKLALAAQQNLTVDAAGNGGIYGNEAGPDTGATLEFSANKVLDDGGRLEAEISINELNYRLEKNNFANLLNEKLFAYLNANIEEKTLDFHLSLIEEYRVYYQSKLPEVERAVRAGVLTQTDLVNVKQSALVLDTSLVDNELRRLEIENIKSQTSLTLFTKELQYEVFDLISEEMKSEDYANLQDLRLQREIIENEIALLESQNNLQSSWRSSISNNNSGLNVFTGVSLQFSVRDGGQRKNKIDALIQSKQGIDEQINFVTRQGRTKINSAREGIKLQEQQLKIMSSKLEGLLEKRSDIENKVRSGRAKIDELIQQMMQEFELKLQIAQLELDIKKQIMSMTMLINKPCILISKCVVIERLTGDL